MKKWTFSAIIYLLVVIAGYYLYINVLTDGDEQTQQSGHESHAGADDKQDGEKQSGEENKGHGEHGSEEGDHGHGNTAAEQSEVTSSIKLADQKLIINLQDLSGNPVTELEVNHEKLLHLIIVDEHLEGYYHLHPNQVGDGIFEVEHHLPDGSYTAFIDIKPKDLDYVVEPIQFTKGDKSEGHSHDPLELDTEYSKIIDGHTISLTPVSFEDNAPITLEFELPNVKVEPYLGAMGHVVILDENAEKYIHVHPVNDQETIFETQFDTPGIYKLWAEFKINGTVSVFPFVFEVK